MKEASGESAKQDGKREMERGIRSELQKTDAYTDKKNTEKEMTG